VTTAEDKQEREDSSLNKMDVITDVCIASSSTQEPTVSANVDSSPAHVENVKVRETKGTFNPPIVELPLVEPEKVSSDVSRSIPAMASSTQRSDILDFTNRNKNLGKFLNLLK